MGIPKTMKLGRVVLISNRNGYQYMEDYTQGQRCPNAVDRRHHCFSVVRLTYFVMASSWDIWYIPALTLTSKHLHVPFTSRDPLFRRQIVFLWLLSKVLLHRGLAVRQYKNNTATAR